MRGRRALESIELSTEGTLTANSENLRVAITRNQPILIVGLTRPCANPTAPELRIGVFDSDFYLEVWNPRGVSLPDRFDKVSCALPFANSGARVGKPKGENFKVLTQGAVADGDSGQIRCIALGGLRPGRLVGDHQRSWWVWQRLRET